MVENIHLTRQDRTIPFVPHSMPTFDDMHEMKNNWPSDADGDVFRRMESNGFNFENKWTVDFNIDFEEWPLAPEKENEIVNLLPGCQLFDPDEEALAEGDESGYILVQFEAILTYDFVIEKQKELTTKMKPYGGTCDSWGVLH